MTVIGLKVFSIEILGYEFTTNIIPKVNPPQKLIEFRILTLILSSLALYIDIST